MKTLALAVEALGMELDIPTSVADIGGSSLCLHNDPTMPVLTAQLPQYFRTTLILKRLFDLLLSLCLVAVASPIMLGVAFLVKRENKGPIIFKQERIGLYGKPFTMYKFRSMRPDAHKAKTLLAKKHNMEDRFIFKLKEDPRVTSIGHFIRRTSLDELQQLFNVIKGDMSLVGPRPALAEEVARYDFLYSSRLLAKPGITGLWQISGRSNLNQAESEFADISYIQDWSLPGDIAILLNTVVVVLRGTGSY
ncbi:sugar transferase [Bifidobacterium aemilianum]|nr:sugar transferase [Bifidobacterium aemilianum]